MFVDEVKMSLVDKLEGVHRGDLIVLRNPRGIEVAGYVSYCSTKKITLSLTHPNNINIKDRYIGFWEDVNIRPILDRQTFKLKYFDSYKILEKHSSE